jgi:hypothetical protein
MSNARTSPDRSFACVAKRLATHFGELVLAYIFLALYTMSRTTTTGEVVTFIRGFEVGFALIIGVVALVGLVYTLFLAMGHFKDRPCSSSSSPSRVGESSSSR